MFFFCCWFLERGEKVSDRKGKKEKNSSRQRSNEALLSSTHLHRHHHRTRLLRLVPGDDGEDGVRVQGGDPLILARKGLAGPAAGGLGHEHDEAVRVGRERGVELLGAVDLSVLFGRGGSFFLVCVRVRGEGGRKEKRRRARSVAPCVFDREREKRDDDRRRRQRRALVVLSRSRSSRRHHALCGSLPPFGATLRVLSPEIERDSSREGAGTCRAPPLPFFFFFCHRSKPFERR